MDLENVIYIFASNFAYFGMKPDERFYNIFMYLYNKNILEYDQIAQSEPKSMILNIEGLSSVYTFFQHCELGDVHNFR